MNPYFSIIVPLFNQETKLEKCIESLKGQTYRDFEVLIIDDGSTDGSLALVQKLTEGDARFRIIRHEKNQSVLMARKNGLREACGKYVHFVDIDDYVDLDTFEVLRDCLEKDPADVLIHPLITEPAREIKQSELSEDMLKGLLTLKVFSGLTQFVFSGELTKKVLPCIRDGYCNMAEDYYIMTIVLTFAQSYTTADRPFYHYINEGGMCTGSTGLSLARLDRQISHIQFALDNMREFLSEHSKDHLQYLEPLKMELLKGTMWQYAGKGVTWREFFNYVNYFNKDEFESFFEWLVTELLPLRAIVSKQTAEE